MKNPLRGLRFSLLDFHSVRANLGMKVAMLGIALIPLIYGALYLMAFYDPYGRLDTLPVAVVNEDVPVTTENGVEVHAGDDLVKALEDSGSLEYHFVDTAEEAQAGLEAGTYYNTILIPEDFSEKVASAQGDNPEQARLVLVCNDANNYLSSILGASVMRQVTAEANYAIGENYFVEIFDTIDETGSSLQEAADALPALCVRLQDSKAEAFEIRAPAGGHLRIGEIAAVQDHKPRFAGGEAVDVRVPAGIRDAGVEDLAYRVDQLDVFFDHPAGLGHVTGVPLDVHALKPLPVHPIDLISDSG